ncbi:MAG: zinc ribbon domain-containing protein [Candidatus Thorarchaeota archaeon]
MKLREILILVTGFVMLGVGVAILAVFGESGFFVFPFFFIGDPAIGPFLVIFSLALVILFFWWANSQYPEDARFVKYQRSREEFLKIGGQCQICGNPLPEKAVFCSACGSEVKFDFSDNDSF